MNQGAVKQSNIKQGNIKHGKGLALIKALFLSYLVTGIILLILGLLLYKFSVSNTVVRVGIIFAYIFSSFVGGIIIGKSTKSKKYIWGILLGILYFVIIFVVSMLLNNEIIDRIGSTVMVFIMCSLGGMLGGMVS